MGCPPDWALAINRLGIRDKQREEEIAGRSLPAFSFEGGDMSVQDVSKDAGLFLKEVIERSRNAIEEHGDPMGHLSIKERFALLGESVWPLSFRLTKSTIEAYRLLVEHEVREAMAGRPSLRAAIIQTPAGQIQILGSALWYDQALPQVVVGHKYAAALMATKVPPALLKELKAPWRAFYINIPNRMLLMWDDHLKREVEISGVLVAMMDGGNLVYAAQTNESSVGLHWHGPPSELFQEESTYDITPFSDELSELDQRAQLLLKRLIVGVCLAAQDKNNVKGPSGPPPAPGTSKKRHRGEPTYRTYVLGKPIRMDCRAAVQSYIRGHGKSPEVQSLVSGHFKSQPYGEKRAQRKTVWVEPYWRGDEDAPVLVRPHKIVDAK